MAESVDVIVVGAGVVGLAIGRALALAGREVIVVESQKIFGSETSSRNSEVIHAGIYYQPGGLRAQLCVPGKKMLYRYCAERHVPHLNCEKLIVANDEEEIGRLDDVAAIALQNGVDDLVKLTGKEATRLEPGLNCATALLSPSTGIIDSHSLMLALIGDLEDAGAVLALSSPVESGRVASDGIELSIGGGDPISLHARLVINSAGLYADKVARSIIGLDPKKIPTIRPAKGQYFTYSGKAPFERLIYPLHTPDSQGVHYTRDLAGQGRLGPDIRWDAALGDYSVDETRLNSFVADVTRFWPALDPERLVPGYAGQRPKVSGPGEEGDFQILSRRHHGTRGYIGLYGIESPGLTSCLAIGEHVAAIAASL